MDQKGGGDGGEDGGGYGEDEDVAETIAVSSKPKKDIRGFTSTNDRPQPTLLCEVPE